MSNVDDSCLFCKIVAGAIPADMVLSDEHVIAFRDIAPLAPVHVLVVPRDHHRNVAELADADAALAARVLAMVSRVAQAEGLAEDGYRTVFNTGVHGGQTVFHVHAHVLGGAPQDLPTTSFVR